MRTSEAIALTQLSQHNDVMWTMTPLDLPSFGGIDKLSQNVDRGHKGLLPRVTLGILWLMLGHTR